MDAIQDLDLITTVDLSYVGEEKRPVYHFIYASQLYGTLFAIYAKFDGKNDGKTFEINTITMRLINYKGIINIGFTNDFSIRGKDINSDDFLMKGNEINFGVRGTSLDVEKIVPLSPPIVLTKGVLLPLMFNRTLHPLTEFQTYQGRSAGPLGTEPPTTELFDSEFYGRDGSDFYKQEPREGMDGYQPPPLRHSIIGGRCLQSNVSVRF